MKINKKSIVVLFCFSLLACSTRAPMPPDLDGIKKERINKNTSNNEVLNETFQ